MVSVDTGQIRVWLEQVCDPEIPVISVTDLGIVRDIIAHAEGSVEIIITPTYSGCPAMEVIAAEMRTVLQQHGIDKLIITSRLAPAWTTDWMSAAGKEKLRRYGIAPPAQQVIDISGIARSQQVLALECPQCGSAHTRLVSQFGSTACKALYRCLDCLEPFDYFKAH